MKLGVKGVTLKIPKRSQTEEATKIAAFQKKKKSVIQYSLPTVYNSS